jgi:phage-related protein
MEGPLLKIPLFFYRTPTGAEPVREGLRELHIEDRNAIGQDLMRVQYRWPIGMPLCRPLGKGLWGVRSSLWRAIASLGFFFFIEDGRIGVLHGFVKRLGRRPQTPLRWRRRA